MLWASAATKAGKSARGPFEGVERFMAKLHEEKRKALGATRVLDTWHPRPTDGGGVVEKSRSKKAGSIQQTG